MEGALTTLPRVQAVPPVRNTSASSMQSPPASADATSVIILSPVLARPGARPRSKCRSTSWGRPRCKANVAGRISPALLTRRWSSKAMRMRSGWWRGSISWVLLVSGWFSISKTIIPDAQEHFLTHSTRRDTHLFGGFGIRAANPRRTQGVGCVWRPQTGFYELQRTGVAKKPMRIVFRTGEPFAFRRSIDND